MKKIILNLFIIAFFGSFSAVAQQDDFSWRLGYGAGVMHGITDVSHKLLVDVKEHYTRFDNKGLAQGLFLEKRISPGVGFQANYNWGSFWDNDLRHTVEKDGEGNRSPYFLRALNYKTEVKDYSAALVFDVSSSFFFTPYLYVGIGRTEFEVFGDLENGNGNPYDYRNLAINDTGEGDDLEQIDESGIPPQDGIYETNLTNIGTELDAAEDADNGGYDTKVWNIPMGIGVKIRLNERLGLHLQTDVKYVFSDHLDDISDAPYKESYDNSLQELAALPNTNYEAAVRGNDNGRNDIYAFTSVSLRYSFGRKQAAKVGGGKRGKGLKDGGGRFKGPVFYSSSSKWNTEKAAALEAAAKAKAGVAGEETMEDKEDEMENEEVIRKDKKKAKKKARKARKARTWSLFGKKNRKNKNKALEMEAEMEAEMEEEMEEAEEMERKSSGSDKKSSKNDEKSDKEDGGDSDSDQLAEENERLTQEMERLQEYTEGSQKREAQLQSQVDSLRNVVYKLADAVKSQQSEVGNEGGGRLGNQFDRINDRIDNLLLKMSGSTVVMTAPKSSEMTEEEGMSEEEKTEEMEALKTSVEELQKNVKQLFEEIEGMKK